MKAPRLPPIAAAPNRVIIQMRRRSFAIAGFFAVVMTAAGIAAPAFAEKQWKCTGNAGIPWSTQIVECTKAIKSGEFKGKELAWAYFNRGNANIRTGRHDNAIADYSEALKLEPTDADIYNNRGNALRRKGQYDRAIADYNEAIKLAPNDPDPVNGRGNAYFNKGDRERALEDFNRAIKLDPDTVQAYFNRARVREDKGDLYAALTDFETYAKLEPSDADGPAAVRRVRMAIKKNEGAK